MAPNSASWHGRDSLKAPLTPKVTPKGLLIGLSGPRVASLYGLSRDSPSEDKRTASTNWFSMNAARNTVGSLGTFANGEEEELPGVDHPQSGREFENPASPRPVAAYATFIGWKRSKWPAKPCLRFEVMHERTSGDHHQRSSVGAKYDMCTWQNVYAWLAGRTLDRVLGWR